MQKAIVWYGILLKENILRKTTWIATVSMLFLLVIVSQIHLPDTKNMVVGICSDGTECENAIISDLYKQQGVFKYQEYAGRQNLYEDVQSGRLECGFILSKQLKERMDIGDLKKCVTYISSPYSSKGEVAKETFYASFLRVYSKQILKQSDQEIFTNPDNERLDAMEKANERFMQSDFFRLEQVTVDTEADTQNKGRCYPVQGLFGIFLLGFMYFANGRKFDAAGRWMRNCLNRKDAVIFSTLQTLSAVTLPAVAGFALLFPLDIAHSAGEELCRMLLFLMIGVPWIVLYVALARSQESFIAYGIVLIVMELLLYPVIGDIAVYIPAVKAIRYMTPLEIIL